MPADDKPDGGLRGAEVAAGAGGGGVPHVTLDGRRDALIFQGDLADAVGAGRDESWGEGRGGGERGKEACESLVLDGEGRRRGRGRGEKAVGGGGGGADEAEAR